MFVRQLVDNLKRATEGLGVDQIWATRMMVRMHMVPDADWEKVRSRTEKVFGAVKMSLANKTEPDYLKISELVAMLAQSRPFSTFRVSANRADKSFPLTSHEINVKLGDEVRRATGAKVDLSNPEINLHVEIQRDDAFVYADDYSGAGGLPVGTAGKVAVLMSGGIDSPVATWRMMRRGCKAILVHFHAFPLVEGRSRDKAKELAETLNLYQFDTKLFLVPFASVQRQIILEVPGQLRVIAYRRFMVRIAEAIGRAEGARALVTGESVGQVGSQTLQNLATVGEVATIPMLRPLVGMDKQEIIDQAQAIGTFDTSIQPDEDCCTLFVPRSPSTAVKPWQIAEQESKLDIEALVAEAVAATELVEYHSA